MKYSLIDCKYRIFVKKSVLTFCLSFVLISGTYLFALSSFTNKTNQLQNGDIIFQASQSAQSQAVRLATHSSYTHCGVVFNQNKKILIYEAVQPVKTTSFEDWIKHGKDNKYVVKRLKNASTVLDQGTLAKMKACADKYKEKDYDIYFGWSDERIYCSELVWKIYKQGADIEVGKLQKLKDFDLTSAAVKEKLKERYGNKIPLEETVISPQSIFESELLMTVVDTY